VKEDATRPAARHVFKVTTDPFVGKLALSASPGRSPVVTLKTWASSGLVASSFTSNVRSSAFAGEERGLVAFDRRGEVQDDRIEQFLQPHAVFASVKRIGRRALRPWPAQRDVQRA